MYCGARVREDYRRCNLDQGAFVVYRACAQQNPSAALMSVAIQLLKSNVIIEGELLILQSSTSQTVLSRIFN